MSNKSTYPADYILKMIGQAIEFAEAEQDFSYVRKWAKEMAHCLEQDNEPLDIHSARQHFQRYLLALERVALIAKTISSVTDVAGMRSRQIACPHGNCPSYPTHAWWCDGCFGELRNALMELNNAHAWLEKEEAIEFSAFYHIPTKILCLSIPHEQFVVKFTDADEWNAITLASGAVYDIHLLIGDGMEDEVDDELGTTYELSMYFVRDNERDYGVEVPVLLKVVK